MPRFGTTLLDRVGMILVLLPIAVNFPSKADESDKKLTNAATSATTTLSPPFGVRPCRD